MWCIYMLGHLCAQYRSFKEPVQCSVSRFPAQFWVVKVTLDSRRCELPKLFRYLTEIVLLLFAFLYQFNHMIYNKGVASFTWVSYVMNGKTVSGFQNQFSTFSLAAATYSMPWTSWLCDDARVTVIPFHGKLELSDTVLSPLNWLPNNHTNYLQLS